MATIIYGKELPDECDKAVKELKKLKVYSIMIDDYIDDFSDLWFRVRQECDMFEQDAQANVLTYRTYKAAENWLIKYTYLYDKYENK